MSEDEDTSVQEDGPAGAAFPSEWEEEAQLVVVVAESELLEELVGRMDEGKEGWACEMVAEEEEEGSADEPRLAS